MITHQYSSPGVYLVYHEINSPAPNLFTDWNISDTVFIYPKPDVSFNTSNTCKYENITFTNNSTIDNSINGMPFQQINNNKWYVNNVFVSASVDLNYTFNNAGPTWIKLECWSNFNCYSVDSVLIDIYDQPRPNFVTTSHCEGESTFFDASSSLGSSLYNSVLDTFYWDLNGGNGIDSINNVLNGAGLDVSIIATYQTNTDDKSLLDKSLTWINQLDTAKNTFETSNTYDMLIEKKFLKQANNIDLLNRQVDTLYLTYNKIFNSLPFKLLRKSKSFIHYLKASFLIL